MQKQITNSRTQIRRNETYIRGYRKAVYDVAQYIDDYDAMKLSFHQCLYPYVADNQRKQEDVDKDILKEFKAQKQFLESSNKKLNYQLQQMQTLHKEDNLNIMNENVALIKDVADLREEVKKYKGKFNNQGGTKALDQIKAAKERLAADAEAGDNEGRHAHPDDELEQVDGLNNRVSDNLAQRKEYIAELRNQLAALQ